MGVLNLESSLYDVITQAQPLILSFSAAVARRLLTQDVLQSSNEVIDRAAQAMNHRHTMDSQLDVLQKEIDGLGLSGSQHVSLYDQGGCP